MHKPLLAYVLFTVLGAFSASAQKGFEIKIKLKGYNQPKMYLGHYYADKEYVKDSAVLDKKGYYVFTGTEPLGCGIYEAINVNRDLRLFEFIINTNEQFFTIETDTADIVANMKVTGSNENTKFYEYQKYISTIGPRHEKLRKAISEHKNNPDSLKFYREALTNLDKEVMKYREVFIKENPTTVTARVFKAMIEPEVPEPPKNPDGSIDSTFQFRYYKEHYWDNVDFSEDCLIRTPVFHRRLERYIKNLTIQIPDSINATADVIVAKARPAKEIFHYVVWWITNEYEKSQFMCMDGVFVHMGLKYYTYDQAFWADTATIERVRMRAMTLAPLRCNQVAPNLAMKDTAHKYQVLHNVDAKFTALVFWDPDCSHCKKEIPLLKKTYDSLKKYGLEVYAVGVELEYDKWKSFIIEHKLDWINVIDLNNETNFRAIYDINSTPVIYLLDKDKKIVAKKLSVEQMEDILLREFGLKDKNAPVLDNKEKDPNKQGVVPDDHQ